jgi:hypothetical protein
MTRFRPLVPVLLRLGFLSAVFLSAPLASASAAVIFDNGPSDDQSGRGSDFDRPVQTANDFVLAEAAILTIVNWVGGYNFDSPTPTAVDDFTIRLFNDVGGSPALVPFAEFDVGNAVNRMDTGTTYNCFPTCSNVFAYSAIVPATLLLASTQYYISIIANTAGFQTDWFWGSSSFFQGDETEWFRLSAADTAPWRFVTGDVEHVFSLEGVVALSVSLDIKPGSDPSVVNPLSRGVVPVAIFGSDDFDVADIDVMSLTFGFGDALPASVSRRNRDVDADGFPDLLLHFRIAETGIEIGDTEACLSGETLDGTPFSGCDTIRTVPDR